MVSIDLLRQSAGNEQELLDELEVLDDLTLMKFRLDIEKKWLIDLHIN